MKIWRNYGHKFTKFSDKTRRTAERKNRLGMYFLDFLPWGLCLERKTLGLGILGGITQRDCQVENDCSWGRGKNCLTWTPPYEVEIHLGRCLFVIAGGAEQRVGESRRETSSLREEEGCWRGDRQGETGSWNGEDGETISVATRAEVSSQSRHVITHEGSQSLIFPHTVGEQHSDQLAQDRGEESLRGSMTFPEAQSLKNKSLMNQVTEMAGRKSLKQQQKESKNMALGDLLEAPVFPALVFLIINILAHISAQGHYLVTSVSISYSKLCTFGSLTGVSRG